ncbi:protein-disulfide isomerase [Caulobacter ginsengisoli]|uniref:Protein-disulfide isomerase n=1 Tax=Caulobacter ginsengisoli TaxID=400775 RepID=A0ABU0IVC4_9CAUL|nr:DsbA family protein [Caulobacter ginsengisoli]MDQ0465949.1 protein-disulfide isomerase [Caulobacter ginsengisoli]
MTLLNRRGFAAGSMLLGLGLAGGLTATLAGCNSSATKVETEDMTLGDPKAPITMIEYASVACPHCAAFNNDVWPEFKKKYVDTGKVYYVSREMLTGEPSVAAAGFLIARCAGKDKYFTVTDQIYHSQPEMFADRSVSGARAVLQRIANSAGLSDEQFEKCINDTKALDELNKRNQKYGTRDKIEGTPTFLMNGKQVADGEVTMAQMDAAVAATMADLKK